MLHICIDFDGVLHSYTSGWKGVDVIPDLPVGGAIAWLIDLMDDSELTPVIYSSRSKEDAGIQAMKDWIYKWTDQLFSHQMAMELVHYLQFPTQKPAAFLTIDDRAVQFRGIFPSIKDIKAYKPWTKYRNEPEPISTVIELLKVVQDSHASMDKTRIVTEGSQALKDALKILENRLI